jgi:hypothetical protein
VVDSEKLQDKEGDKSKLLASSMVHRMHILTMPVGIHHV